MAATEDTIREILAQIDQQPADWRNLCLILADACRDCGREAVADAILEDIDAASVVVSVTRAIICGWLFDARGTSTLGRYDRRWVAHVMLPDGE